ncbi:TPA: glycosyltransferase family 2 protein [Stenotrophomonas maltophilia]|nr:glycosyltransferase family 2 protein [Stenotrophomonas maltophilia]HDS1024805.1 glycosyltransferase family 2 protein [Stenotrophomonas maltophilia]HDS1028849.1 glycosyltransferase family 2 protein [Stenotrophomonas maltophilia]HDS1032971.1 glycosyltransferase family 2 protein [Stenotrophomonas maltophilia]
MKTALFLAMCMFICARLLVHAFRRPSRRLHSIDAIVPAYNEAPCLERSLTDLLHNPYIARVICVNDGSTDATAQVLDALQARWRGRLVAVHQANTGKGGALMHGLQHVTAEQVFLTDADTRVDPDSTGLGHLLAEIERGADAVGGVPSSCLQGAGLLPHVRASLKLPMIVIKRSFQQWLGGAPFIVSGSCGLFRTAVLRRVGFSDRTRVEDLDMSWSLVAQGYRVRQSIRCVVYPQECNTLREEWRRWRRWIVGYAVCMRLHRGLLLTRFGIFSILPMILLALAGVALTLQVWFGAATVHGPGGLVLSVMPLFWIAIVMLLALISAVHHRRAWLVPAAALSMLYVLLAYAIWLVHGLAGLFTGREPARDKPTRYPHVVD